MGFNAVGMDAVGMVRQIVVAPVTPPTPNPIDPSMIPSSRTVNFGGGTNRVNFDGGTNRVNF